MLNKKEIKTWKQKDVPILSFDVEIFQRVEISRKREKQDKSLYP